MIKLGVISLEHPHIGGSHFPALRYIQNRVKVVAIAHHDKQATQPWLDMFSAEYFTDRDQLLAKADVDAVIVTSRNNNHAADSVASAEAGKDVFCDKPVATSTKDAQAIVTAVRENNVRFVTTFPLRFNVSVQQLKQTVDSGKLGKIQAIVATNHGCMYEPGAPEWIKDPEQNGGGCLIDHSVHVADAIRWITGEEFADVRAETITALHDIPGEDIAVLHGRMSEGTIYQIDASWSRRDRDPMWGDCTFRFVGTEGSASLDLYNTQRMEIYADDGVSFRYPLHILREAGDTFLDYAESKEQGKTPVYADEIDGLRTIELAYAAYESVENKQRVKLNLWQ